jgi:hypothetical protein
VTTTAQTDKVYGNRAIVILGIIVGLFVVSLAANYSPEFINGILLLVLVGTILGNSPKWLPHLAAFGNVGSAAVRTPTTAVHPGAP